MIQAVRSVKLPTEQPYREAVRIYVQRSTVFLIATGVSGGSLLLVLTKNWQVLAVLLTGATLSLGVLFVLRQDRVLEEALALEHDRVRVLEDALTLERARVRALERVLEIELRAPEYGHTVALLRDFEPERASERMQALEHALALLHELTPEYIEAFRNKEREERFRKAMLNIDRAREDIRELKDLSEALRRSEALRQLDIRAVLHESGYEYVPAKHHQPPSDESASQSAQPPESDHSQD